MPRLFRRGSGEAAQELLKQKEEITASLELCEKILEYTG